LRGTTVPLYILSFSRISPYVETYFKLHIECGNFSNAGVELPVTLRWMPSR